MGIPFDLGRINNVYVDALKSDRTTLVFDVRNGAGVFVFMMFFSEQDDSKDQLFLYLSRTARMLALKMYGRHLISQPERNSFTAYLNKQDQDYIREELGLQGGGTFDFEEFLRQLNCAIPQHLSFADLHDACSAHAAAFREPALRNVVEEASKIYLIGPKRLPPGKSPQERTLRKLYLHVKSESDVLQRLIAALKDKNMTVAWTDDPLRANGDLRQMLQKL